MTKLFIIVVAATVFNGSLLSEVKPVIHLNKLLSISQSEGLWPYGVASSNLIEKGIGTISVKQKIIYYDIESGEIIQTMKLDQRKRYSMDPISFGFIKGNIASIYFNPSIGIVKFGIFDLLSGKVMRSVDHHMSSDRKKLVYLKEEDSFVVGGLFMTGYKKILDLYDENSFNPSQYSLSKFREFFEKNRAYSLCKYDQQLNIIDSADFVSHTGENLEVYI
ncbi:MAG: hypothetical protein U9Q77_03690, partial [Candidatus Marinimicrobia bacterium]|nr:hypothetical protein [Candidatus Neomarinimicrobiota bacterium]